jgi:hypothetical protein
MTTSLSVSVSVAQFGAAVAVSSILATEIDYIELTSVGRTDTTGRFRYIEEIAIVIDENSKEFHKRLATEQGTEDRIFKTLEQVSSDSFTLFDSEDHVAQKAIADEVGFVDLLFKLLAQASSDSVAPLDEQQFTLLKAAASDFTPTDLFAQSASKALTDSVSLTETFSKLLTYVRAASDEVSVTDQPVLLLISASLAELTPVSDVALVTFGKTLFDGVSMDDGTSVGDGSTYSLQKNLNNIVFMLDTEIRAVTKASAEQITAPDSGSVFATNYCDITYFAEAYVGVSTTF